MLGNIVSLLGWSFLPNLAARWVQSFYYALVTPAGQPRPVPGTPRYASDRRHILVAVISLYLLYTVAEAVSDLRAEPSYYADLGVPTHATERDIRSRFRRLAALHHPDKAGPDAADYFMHLKTAAEVLSSEPKRFAYDRFGPAAVAWRGCSSVRDFVVRGVTNGVVPHYVVGAALVYVLGLMGYLDWERYYRWLAMATLCLFELYCATRPVSPLPVVLLNRVLAALTTLPPLLQFQVVALARKLAITLYLAFSQLGPLVQSSATSQLAAGDDAKALRDRLDALEDATQALGAETGHLWEMEVAPFAGDADAVKSLGGKMGEWLVQNTIRADPMVKDALGSSIRRRRVDAPASARRPK